MKIFKNVPFTMVSNEIFKQKPSLKAIGLYSYICNKPDGWDFSLEGTATQVKDGIDSVRTALHELEEYGFIECRRERKSNGKLGDGVWIINNSPLEKPTLENPTLEKPTLVKPGQVYKKEVRTNKVNNKVESKYTTLASLTETDFQEIADKYRVNISAVRNSFEALTNYCESRGKRYLNYKAALRNFVHKDIERNPNLVLKIKNTIMPDLPVISEEQRIANLQRLQEMRNKVFGTL